MVKLNTQFFLALRFAAAIADLLASQPVLDLKPRQHRGGWMKRASIRKWRIQGPAPKGEHAHLAQKAQATLLGQGIGGF